MKKRRDVVAVEVINRKKYFVARNTKGQFLGRKQVKGSKLTVSQARDLYRQNGTFRQDLKREIYVGTHVNEISLTTSTYKTNKKGERVYAVGDKPKGKKVQYVCSGVYKGETIVARSRFIDPSDKRKAQSSSEAKRVARNDFLAKLGQKFNKDNRYDADEGKLHIEEVRGYREGWVYYVGRKD